MNLQTKYVRTNFVPSGSVSYNQSIAKKYYKSQKKQVLKTKSQNTICTEPILEYEVVSSQLEKGSKRVEIEKWLKNMDLSSKFKVFSIQNKWLSQMIQQMFYYYRANCRNKFLLKPEEFPNEEYYLQYYYNESHQNYLNVVNENNYQFDIYFKYAALQDNNSLSEERTFLEKIRFFDLKDSNDSFTLSVSLLNNLEELFYYFDFFSKKKAFTNSCTYNNALNRVTYDNLMKLYNCNYPTWFNIKSYNSIPEIIIAHLEQILFVKYWIYEVQCKIISPDKNLYCNFSVQEDQKFNEMINNRHNIIKFLKADFSLKKEKLFEKIDLNFLINEIKNDHSIINKIKNKRPEMNKIYCYRINSFRCDFFDNYIYSSELDYYKLNDEVRRMFADLSEENFVDELLFSNLERTQSYEEYMFKKLFDKLYNLYSDKNVIELLRGDYDNNKKDKKKKGKRKINPSEMIKEKEDESKKEHETIKVELESKYKNFLESVYMNSVEKSKILIKDMCKNIALSLINNVVDIEKLQKNEIICNKIDLLNNVTFLSRKEIINKETLINQLNKELDRISYMHLENTENISVNDETTYSSTNISDNKSSQNILKADSPSSDKNRRIISKNLSKNEIKRSNSNKTNLSTPKDPCENKIERSSVEKIEFPYKEGNDLKFEEKNKKDDLSEEEGKNDENIHQKKKKNKYKKFKNRKGSSNFVKVNTNNADLIKKKKISENVKSIQLNNSDKKKPEITQKEVIPQQTSNEKEFFSQSYIENQNIHSNTSHFNNELNEKICQNIQFFSLNNKIVANSNNNPKPKYNKYNNIQSTISTKNQVYNHIMTVCDDINNANNIKNIYNIPIQNDYKSQPQPTQKYFPFISNSVFPNNIEYDQKYFMTMMNPFLNKPLDNFNILSKFDPKFFHKNFEIRLHNDILDYSNNIIKINNILKEVKLFSLNYIENLIKQFLGSSNIFIDIHGSFATDLSIECSDIDLTVRLTEFYNNIESLISTLYTQFEKMHIFDSLVPIYTASVPIIKIQVDPLKILTQALKEKFKDFKNSAIYNEFIFDREELNKIKIDITFTEKNSKTHCTYSAVEWAKKQLHFYPEIKPLIHVIKRHLQINKLNSSFNGMNILNKGGLSSYSLLLMLVAYIKYCKTVKMRASIDLGSILLEFYEFFGKFFDFSFGVIDINQINPIQMVIERLDTFPIIHDPLNYLNVAKNSFRINEVKEIFSNAFDILQKNKIDLNDEDCYFDNNNLVYDLFFFFKKSIILSNN